MRYKTISFTEKGAIDVYYDAKYRCCLFCPYGFVDDGDYEDGDYYADGREFFCNIVCSCDYPSQCERFRYSWMHETDIISGNQTK